MKRKVASFFILGVLVIMFSMTTPAIGQSTSEDFHKETHEAWEAFKAYVAGQKHKAVAHGKELLEKTDAEIDKLENKAANASGETKSRYDEEIKMLKQKRANAAEKLDELEDSSEDGWEATKEGFVNAYKDLYDAYREAVSKF